jgi:HAMP domain-containing protein
MEVGVVDKLEERLRAADEDQRAKWPILFQDRGTILAEAADEITRLNAEVERLTRELSKATGRQRVSIVDQDGNEVGHTHRSMAELLREDAWRDDNGTIWNPPTAWAYFAVCRARDAQQALIGEMAEGMEGMKRPIIGIENRTAREVFDIMVDRIPRALILKAQPPVKP